MIVGLFFIGLIAVGAMTIDMSRLGILRAELQVSADAGAHAGIVEFLQPGPLNTGRMLDSARAYALKNTALGTVVTVDELEVGHWNGFDFVPAGSPTNAVHIQVSVQSVGLIMEILGVSSPVVHATSIASTADFPAPPATCGVSVGPNTRRCPSLVR